MLCLKVYLFVYELVIVRCESEKGVNFVRTYVVCACVSEYVVKLSTIIWPQKQSQSQKHDNHWFIFSLPVLITIKVSSFFFINEMLLKAAFMSHYMTWKALCRVFSIFILNTHVLRCTANQTLTNIDKIINCVMSLPFFLSQSVKITATLSFPQQLDELVYIMRDNYRQLSLGEVEHQCVKCRWQVNLCCRAPEKHHTKVQYVGKLCSSSNVSMMLTCLLIITWLFYWLL